MSTLGPGHMPRLGSNVIDEDGLRLIRRWIGTIPGSGVVADSQELRAQNQAMRLLSFYIGQQPSEQTLRATIDPILASTSSAMYLADELAPDRDIQYRQQILDRAMKSESPEVRDLFERFLPEEKRIKRLGSVVQPEQILALNGDADRGRKLFFEGPGVQCRNCHRVGGKGTEVGPDLDLVGKKHDRAAILDNILNPSRLIEPKYVTYLLETKRGQAYTGLLVSKDANKVVLKDTTAKLIEVPAGDVEVLAPQAKSLMPELLLRDLTAEQVADLTAFLQSLK
jgi:putative heme-binding domain-containing protein